MLITVYLAKYGNIAPSEIRDWPPEQVRLARKSVDYFMALEAKAASQSKHSGDIKAGQTKEIHKKVTRRGV